MCSLQVYPPPLWGTPVQEHLGAHASPLPVSTLPCNHWQELLALNLIFLGHLLISEVALMNCSSWWNLRAKLREIPNSFLILSSLEGANLALPAARATEIQTPETPGHTQHSYIYSMDTRHSHKQDLYIAITNIHSPKHKSDNSVLIQIRNKLVCFFKTGASCNICHQHWPFLFESEATQTPAGQNQVQCKGSLWPKMTKEVHTASTQIKDSFSSGNSEFVHPAEKTSHL